MPVEMCRQRRDGFIYQERVIRTYKLTGEGGLPIAFLGEETITVRKNNRCVTALRTTAGIVGGGVGAIVGMVVAPLFCITIPSKYLVNSDYLSRPDYDNFVKKWAIHVAVSSMVLGAGIGAVSGKKITTCAVNLIFGKEK